MARGTFARDPASLYLSRGSCNNRAVMRKHIQLWKHEAGDAVIAAKSFHRDLPCLRKDRAVKSLRTVHVFVLVDDLKCLSSTGGVMPIVYEHHRSL